MACTDAQVEGWWWAARGGDMLDVHAEMMQLALAVAGKTRFGASPLQAPRPLEGRSRQR